MALQLYVWGPALNLPSIDAECIAAIAYLSQTTSRADYHLIQSSPSAVPTHHLPALYNPSTRTWTSGFTSILRHLSQNPPPTFHDESASPSSSRTANLNFLLSHCPPLIALSLYVSSTNWSSTTRPAYSKILPMPLPWIEPSNVRAAMVQRAEHLGMSSLDTDAEAEKREAAEKASNAAGWISVPPALRKTTSEAMAPEFTRRIKLEKLARDVLDVIKDINLGDGDEGLRCLAFAYLSLMLVDEVPRKWLSETVRGKDEYRDLVRFVVRFRDDVFAGKDLPWMRDEDSESALGVGRRFLDGAICEVPVLGSEWRRRSAGRRKRKMLEDRGLRAEELEDDRDGTLLAGAGATVLALGLGVFFYRRLPPFGAAVQVWRASPVLGFGGLGAAGAMLSSVFAPSTARY
ncbi:Metaxin-1 [Podospora fimiseda]|uniref:Metaxin-1 n=1 Tax=Podospora fimiseda TaxID=252190 RepID=A0AAN7H0Y5_9PEZI|nr:Metaxin-1 [Podospora fimiseda]